MVEFAWGFIVGAGVMWVVWMVIDTIAGARREARYRACAAPAQEKNVDIEFSLSSFGNEEQRESAIFCLGCGGDPCTCAKRCAKHEKCPLPDGHGGQCYEWRVLSIEQVTLPTEAPAQEKDDE